MLLASGKILILEQGTNNRIYDPATRTSTTVPAMDYNPHGIWARLLPDARVLVRGLYDFGRNIGSDNASVYNPETNTATPTSPKVVGSDVLLPNGLVFVTGGRDYRQIQNPILYDPETDSIIPVPPPNVNRSRSSAFLLDDGRVFVFGLNADSPGESAEIYSPAPTINPTPSIGSVTASNPTSDADFISLDIRGSSFLTNSSVELGSLRLVKIYLGSRRLVAFVTPPQRVLLNSVGVRVTNPGPGGGSTATVPVGFATPPPTITSITPNTAAIGTEFTALVSGQNLSNIISVNFSGTGVSSTVQSGGGSGSIILNIRVANDAAPGSRSMTVVTGSGTFTFTDALIVQRATAPVTAPLPIAEVETGPIRSGYVIITPDAGSIAPVATLTYGMVRSAVVQSQAAILPTPLLSETSFQVDVVQPIGRNLGLAVANAGGSAASLTLTLRYEDGTAASAPLSITLPARQQLARFVSELFPAGAVGAAFRGNLDIQSSTPVSIIGLRFAGVEFSTLPTSGTASFAGVPTRVLSAGQTAETPSEGSVGGATATLFPQFAMSGGWATTLGLLNTTSSAITGRVDVFDTSGNPMAVTLNGSTKSTFRYTIPARGSLTLAPRDANGQSPF